MSAILWHCSYEGAESMPPPINLRRTWWIQGRGGDAVWLLSLVKNDYVSSASFSWDTNCGSLNHHVESMAIPRLPCGEPVGSGHVAKEKQPQLRHSLDMWVFSAQGLWVRNFRGDWSPSSSLTSTLWETPRKNCLTGPYQNQDLLSK